MEISTSLFKTCLLFCCFFVTLTSSQKLQENPKCPDGFQQIYENSHSEPYCIAVFNEPENWNMAYNVCRHFDSHLLHFYNKSSNNTHIEAFIKKSEPIKNDKEASIHFGIRRRNGIYIWNGPRSEIFWESTYRDQMGPFWNASEPREECVALHIHTGKLFTVRCDEKKLKFACITEEYTKTSMLCDESWEFAYLTNKCLKYVRSRQSLIDANKTCRNFGGRLISQQSFESIIPALLFRNRINDYAWINITPNHNEGSCDGYARKVKVNGSTIFSCNNKFLVMCEKDVNKVDIKVESSSDEAYNIPFVNIQTQLSLNCKIQINGEVYSPPKKFTLIWWKNLQPTRLHDNSIMPELHVSRIFEQENKEGVYYCEVLIPGYPYFVYSPSIEVFFTGMSSFLFTLKGRNIPYDPIEYDYSKPSFRTKFMPILNETMEFLFRDFANELPKLSAPVWNFINVSQELYNNRTLINLKLLLSVNYNKKDRPSDQRTDVYEPLKKYIRKKVAAEYFNYWNLTDQNLITIGVCYKESDYTSHYRVINWEDSYHSDHVVSTPPCLSRQWKLIVRKCDGGYFTGAKWDDFTYYQCVQFSEKSKPNHHTCHNGYEPWEYETCIQINSNPSNWSSAVDKCNLAHGYVLSPSLTNNLLLDFSTYFKEFGNNEMWLGAHRKNKIFQWIAYYPRAIHTNNLIRWAVDHPKLKHNCVSGVFSRDQITLYSRSCEEVKPFVCMHQNLGGRLHKMSKCPQKWYGSPWSDACYTITDQTYDRSEASHHCREIGGFLATIPKPEDYDLIKKYIRSFDHRHHTWWIGLNLAADMLYWSSKGNRESPKYVDWEPKAEFHEENYVALKRMPDFNIKWTTANKTKKFAAICEMELNEETTKTRIEIVNTREDLNAFQCVTARRYYDSVTWYKDGMAVYGTRGLIESDSDIFDPKDILGSKSIIPLQNKWELQGYYWCEVDQAEPFTSVASKKVLLILDEIWTFVAQFVATKVTEEWDPSDGIYWTKREEFGTRIIDDLIPCKTFTPNCSIFVDAMVPTETGLSVRFYIYVEIPVRSRRSLDLFEEKGKYVADLKNHINKYLEAVDEFGILPGNVLIKNTDGCFAEKTDIDGVTLSWPNGKPYEIVFPKEFCITKDGQPVTRRCLGNFTHGNYWGHVDGKCSGQPTKLTLTLKTLSEQHVDRVSITEAAKELESLTDSSSKLQGIDLHYIATTIEKFSEVQFYRTKDLKMIVSSINSVLNVGKEISNTAQTKCNSSTRITASLENILKHAAGNHRVLLPNVGLYRSRNSNRNVSKTAGIAVMPLYEGDNSMEIDKISLASNDVFPVHNIKSGILLPEDLLTERASNSSYLIFMIYKDDSMFVTEQKDRPRSVVTSVIYAFVSGEPVRLKKSRIKIFFNYFQPENQKPNTQKCVFWDRSLNHHQGDWSTEGCVLRTEGQHFVCECDHLTNFAVLVDLYGEESDEGVHGVVLNIITYAGCTLSIFGLLLTIITFLMFRKLRKGLGSQVLCNLAISLLATLIVFMAGINQTSSKPTCMLVAALLHYLLLVSFSWMLVEAVLQYLRFVKVIGTYIPRFMLKASVCAWGIPLVITASILAIDYELYHGGKNYCWLHKQAFYYGFLLPIALVILFNVFIFCLVIYSISCGRQKGLRTNQNERKLAITRLRAAFCILVLLGLSWGFGFFAVSSAKLAFQYLFSIFTTLQGFFIFIFHVIQEKTTRDLWYDCICQKKGSHMQVFSTRDTSLSAKDTTVSFNSTAKR